MGLWEEEKEEGRGVEVGLWENKEGRKEGRKEKKRKEFFLSGWVDGEAEDRFV